MKIKYKVGCLIEAAKEGEVDIIAHQTNCKCLMENGIAPLIADAFDPVVRNADYLAGIKKQNILGNYSKAIGFNYVGGGVTIFNLYGQYDRGEDINNLYTDYSALSTSLEKMANYLYANYLPEYRKLGLPKLGAGRANGDWEIIYEIIKTKLEGFDVTIYVLNKDEIPIEVN